MFNKVILMGNLTRDPELRYLPSGSAVCSTAIATNRRFKKQDGSQSEEVCFIEITFFNRSAEIANQYLKKGSQILVEGRLRLEQWTDKTGAKKSRHVVMVETMQMVGSRNIAPNSGGENYQNQNNFAPQQPYDNQPRNNEIPEIDINDDEIPF